VPIKRSDALAGHDGKRRTVHKRLVDRLFRLHIRDLARGDLFLGNPADFV
jgi:hypothetical protein